MKIVILGAGLAGLAAAFELDEAGHDVLVLEATDRPGGRVLTLRQGFSDGLYADAGAMAFSDGYRNVLRFAEQLAVPIEPLESRWAQLMRSTAHYHLRGQHLVARSDGTADWPFDLTDVERALGRRGILRRYLLEAFAPEGMPEDLARLPTWARAADESTLADFMRARGASEAAVELVRCTFWFGRGMDETSAASCLVSDVGLFFRDQKEFCFAGGTDRLPLALARHLGAKIQYRAEVVRIHGGPDALRIAVRRGDNIEQVEADRAVCTLPFSVLRGVEIDPPWSEQKNVCVRELGYAAVTRVFLQVRRRFWQQRGMMGFAYTDLPIQRVIEQPMLPPPSVGDRSLLEAYVVGAAALKLDALSPERQTEFVLAEMERVHPGTRGHFEGAVSKSWAEDPWARGAYCVFTPGWLTQRLALVQRPEGRVHFAGEHTSRMSGTMEGALESGIRAGREIAASV